MKKITLLAVAFVAISFASCKKKYTCVCGTLEVESTAKMKKKDAKTWCESNTAGSCKLK